MTEAEAKTKWCPMVRAMYEVRRGDKFAFAACNVFVPPEDNLEHRTLCVGSACMMFRVKYPVEPVSAPDQECYCGLAGMP